MTAPAPLTPPECDLRDFGFMPLDVRRFRDSDLVAFEAPEAVLAAIMLWGAAWHAVPAASLTDDDRALAQLAGYGRSVKEFMKVKAGALRGFVKCSDGRLYHPVVAAKAREAWAGKLQQRYRTECARIRKHNERNPDDKQETPTFENWLHGAKSHEIRQENLNFPEKTSQARAHPGNANTVPENEKPQKTAEPAPNVTRDTEACHTKVARDMASKGQGEGKGQGDSIEESDESSLTLLSDLTAELAAIAGVPMTKDKTRQDALEQVGTWIAEGIEPETLRAAIRTATGKSKSASWSLKRFAAAVRHEHAKKSAKAAPGKKAARPQKHLPPDEDDQRIADLRSALQKHLAPHEYDRWLKPTRMAMNGVGVVIAFPSAFGCDWTEQHLGRTIGTVAASLALGSVKLTVA